MLGFHSSGIGGWKKSPIVLPAHLWCSLSELCRIQDEFERVCVLVLFHKLEVDEPFGLGYGLAVGEPAAGPFKQRGRELVFAVGGQALHRPDELLFRYS